MHGQIVFSLAAFSFLAFACARSARTGSGRIFLFAFPLLLSLTPSIVRWNFLALSESLAISLFAVLVAVWILFLSTRRSSFWLAGAAMAALLWGGTRDANAWVLVMIAGATMLAASGKWSRAPLTALGVWFVLLFALSNVSANAGNRWLIPFLNVMAQRILPVPEHVSYFADHGMPIGPALLGRAGSWASEDGWAFHYAPDLEKFRVWTADDGRVVYMKFLISRPIRSMTAPALGVSSDFLRMARATLVDPTMHLGPDHPPSHSKVALICFVLGNVLTAFLAFVLWRRGWLRRFPHLAVPLVMVLLSAPHAWLVWHGDAMETARHNLTAFVQFSLGFVLLWLYALDHWCAVRAGSEGSAREGDDLDDLKGRTAGGFPMTHGGTRSG